MDLAAEFSSPLESCLPGMYSLLFASCRRLVGLLPDISIKSKFFSKKLGTEFAILQKCCILYALSAPREDDGLIAQSVEHRPFKAGVPGSSPGQPTIFLYLLLSIYTAESGKTVLLPGSEVLK